MRPLELREAWRKRPFQPFRIVLTSGTSYVISSAECMIVTETTTAIAIPCETHGDQMRVFDNDQIKELAHEPDSNQMLCGY